MMQFGEAKYISDTNIPAIVIMAMPDGRVIVWTNTFRICRATALRPWKCEHCKGSDCWWTFRQRPTCTSCSPMPSEIVRSLWDEFHSFIAEVAEGSEDREGRAVLWAGFDTMLETGDRTALLQYLFYKEFQSWQLARIRK